MIYTIYKISIADEDYIGSTMDLKQRKIQHKSACYNPNTHNYNNKIYTVIRENGGWDCCEITPIEEYECETKQQALIREEYWRREYKALLNTRQAFATIEERKNYIKEYNLEVNKKPCLNCECGGVYKKQTQKRHNNSKLHQDYLANPKN